MSLHFDPTRDLKLERIVDVPAHKIFEAWTTPHLLMPWFCPKPWMVTECEIDLRPGGKFYTRMKGPEPGQEFPNVGCFLEIVKDQRLVWTSALEPGYRPAAQSSHDLPFTAILDLKALGPSSTHYVAYAIHGTPAHQAKHAAMGFELGWSTVLTQLVEFIKTEM